VTDRFRSRYRPPVHTLDTTLVGFRFVPGGIGAVFIPTPPLAARGCVVVSAGSRGIFVRVVQAKSVPPFDAVVFDLDGTLCHRTQDTQRLYQRTFERVGVEPFGDPDALWAALSGAPDHDDRVGYLGAGFARLAAQYERSDVDPLALATAMTDCVDDSQVALRSGARAALNSAETIGPVGLVTNGPERRQRVKLDALGITDRFDARVYAFDLQRRKPHARPFDRALETLDTTPEQTLYVGNSLEYDVAGAHNAGLPAAWLRNGDDPDPYDPEYVLTSVGDVQSLLAGKQ
jgi:putative hydrolase of the HAD superfamily